MTTQQDLGRLFQRDLIRLTQEIEAFDDDAQIWRKAEGVNNSAGNLALHLEGNLREYVGRQLGKISYQRRREEEFSGAEFTRAELAKRLEDVGGIINKTFSELSDEALRAPFPERVLGIDCSTQQFMFHLLTHLNYHLGQIDYLRRFVTTQGAIELAPLPSA